MFERGRIKKAKEREINPINQTNKHQRKHNIKQNRDMFLKYRNNKYKQRL